MVGISTHLFGILRPEDETLLNFPNSAPGRAGSVGESMPAPRVFPAREMRFPLVGASQIPQFNIPEVQFGRLDLKRNVAASDRLGLTRLLRTD